MIIDITAAERDAILFELKSGLETVNDSIGHSDPSFAGEDEMLMTIITKLEASNGDS